MGSWRLENSSIDKFESSRIIILKSTPSLSCAWPFFLPFSKSTHCKNYSKKSVNASPSEGHEAWLPKECGPLPTNPISHSGRNCLSSVKVLPEPSFIRIIETSHNTVALGSRWPTQKNYEIAYYPAVWGSKTAPHCDNISVIRLWAWVGLFIFAATVMISGSRH